MVSTMAAQPRRSTHRAGSKPQRNPAENDESLEKRRQRNRKAQRLFRLRRQAAHANHEKELVHMEGALEQMAATFLDFTNGVLQSPLVTRDPDLILKLRTATDSILFLCQGSNDSQDSPDSGKYDAKTAAAGIDHAGCQHGSFGNGGRPQKQAVDGFLPDLDAFTQPLSAPTSGRSGPAVRPRPSALQPPQIKNIFGNGFMNLPPIDFGDCASTATELKAYPADDSLSIMVTRASMQNAYDAMLNDVEGNTPTVDRIFGFPLKFRTRQEILMVLRWYLRPQTQELVRLATAEFDDYLVAQYYHGIFTSQYRAVEGVFRGDRFKSSDGSSASLAQSRILNAYQIEQWLLACGMKHIDVDMIELTEIKPIGLLLNARPLDDPDVLLATLATLERDVPLHQDHYSAFESQATARYTSPGSDALPKNIRLSRARLIHVLTGISFCIDKGPAYCEQALLEAVVTAMVSDG